MTVPKTIEKIRPTAAQVAERLIAAFTEQNKTRCRISFKTIEKCIGGERASIQFLGRLMEECAGREHPLIELRRGGFAMIAAESLSGAPSLSLADENEYEYSGG